MSRFDLHWDQAASGTSFLDRYTQICEREGLSLFRPVLAKLTKFSLEVNLDVIPKNDLIALLHGLVNDDTLMTIRFESRLLKDNPNLTNDLRKLHLHSDGRRLPAYVEREVMLSLCNALHRHICRNELRLKVLRLIGLPVSDGELSEVCSALPSSKSLHLLSLEGVPLTGRHLDYLLPVLPHVQQLTVLNLARCHLGRAEILQISRYLHDDHKLQRLILNGNPVGDTGVEYLVKVLQHHTAFRALDLQNCGISSTGCISLQSLLRNNLNIELCDIRRNSAISRNSALSIAEILLENNKFRFGGNTYKPLDLDMSPPIDASQITIQDSGLDGVRLHNPPPREVPSVRLPPKDLQLKLQDDYHKKDFALPNASVNKGIFISSDLLSKFETSLVKFQVLLDYLESEHLEGGLGLLGGGPAHSVSTVATQKQQKHCSSVEIKPTVPASQVSTLPPNGSPVSDGKQTGSNPLPKTASMIAKENELPLKEKESSSRKSYSDSFTESRLSSAQLSTARNTTPVTGGTQSAQIRRRQEQQTSTSASVIEATATASMKSATIQKNISRDTNPNGKQRQEPQEDEDKEEQENDRTITSDNELDNGSFEFNFTDIGGITKESSYMKIADEIFDDPKDVLESTRTSPSHVSSKLDGSHSATSAKTSSNTNVDDLQERLRNIQSRYNVAANSIKTLVDNAISKPSQNDKDKTRRDNISTSHGWDFDLLRTSDEHKGSLELSDVSLGSSFSGDLTGSDLEKF